MSRERTMYLLGPLSHRDALLLAGLIGEPEIRRLGNGFYLALASRPRDEAVALASVLAGRPALHEDVGEGPRPVGAALPDTIGGIIGCPNPTCITNQPREKALRRYRVLRWRGRILLQCVYCGTLIGGEELRRVLASQPH